MDLANLEQSGKMASEGNIVGRVCRDDVYSNIDEHDFADEPAQEAQLGFAIGKSRCACRVQP